jgi:hypothetical protein
VIVTDNPADFPPAILPVSLTRQSLDDFLLEVFDLHPVQVIIAIRASAGRTGKSGPAMSAPESRIPLHARHASLRRTTTSSTPNNSLDSPA